MAEEIAPRETYGHTLVELGRENRDIVVLDADLSPSTMTKYFAAEFPERFFQVGIAEQNMPASPSARTGNRTRPWRTWPSSAHCPALPSSSRRTPSRRTR
jgi:transketolase C-terminal domain/subunit